MLLQLEQLRLGIRSYLDPLVDPVVDPIKNLLKTDTKLEAQHVSKCQYGTILDCCVVCRNDGRGFPGSRPARPARPPRPASPTRSPASSISAPMWRAASTS